MHLLFIDQLKKIKKKPFEWFGLVLIVAIVSLTFMTVKPLTERLEAPIDDYLQTQNVEDFHIRVGMPDFNYLTRQQRLALYIGMGLYMHPDFSGFNDRTASPYEMNAITMYIQENIHDYPNLIRDLYASMIHEAIKDYDIDVEINYSVMLEDDTFYYRIITLNDSINKPYLVDGALPGDNEVAIFEVFADKNNLQLGDTLTIKDESYTISGFIYAPDFLLPSLRSTSMLYNPEVETVVITTEDTLFSMGEPFRVFFQGKGDFTALAESFDVTQIMQSDWRVFGRNMRLIESVLPQAFNPRITAASFESSLTAAFVTIFLGLFYGLSIGLILLFMKRWIEAQKEDLEVLSKLGYSKHQLAMALLLVPFSLSLAIVISGIFGLWLSDATFGLYSSRYLMPHMPFTVSLSTLMIGFIVPMIVLNGFSYLYVYVLLHKMHQAQNITVRKMRFKKVYLTVIRSILLVFISVLLLVSFFARDLIDDYQSQSLQGKHFETMVLLNHYREMPKEDGEGFIYGNLNLIAINDTFLRNRSVVLGYGFDPTQTMYRLKDDDLMSNQLLYEGVVVSTFFAVSESVEVGDELLIEVFGNRHAFTVVGISDELLESAIYFDIETLNSLFGFDDGLMYNGYFSEETITSEFGVFRIVNYRAIVDEVEMMFTLTNRIVTALMMLSSLLAIFMFYYFVRGILFEQLDTFLTLKAFGYLPHETFYVFFKRTFIELIIAYIVSIGLSYVFMQVALYYLYQTLGFVFVLNIPWHLVIVALFALLFGVFMLTFLVHRAVSKLPLSMVLKKA